MKKVRENTRLPADLHGDLVAVVSRLCRAWRVVLGGWYYSDVRARLHVVQVGRHSASVTALGVRRRTDVARGPAVLLA